LSNPSWNRCFTGFQRAAPEGTLAERARAGGLAPLADAVFRQSAALPARDAARLGEPGLVHLIAERVALAAVSATMVAYMCDHLVFQTSMPKSAHGIPEANNFLTYADYSHHAANLPAHIFLACMVGVRWDA
jgi:hypothetical protein